MDTTPVGQDTPTESSNDDLVKTTEAERREVDFKSLDDAVADAEQLAQGEVRVSGNHSFAEILEHLARTQDMVTGKLTPPKPPFLMRLMMPILKPFILNGPVKPGFKLPSAAEEFFWPKQDMSVQDALAHFKSAVDNYKKSGPLPVHPVFGKVSKEKNLELNINHCAMHLSFVHPA